MTWPTWPIPDGYEEDETDRTIPGSRPSLHLFRWSAEITRRHCESIRKRQGSVGFRYVTVQSSNFWLRWQVVPLQNVLVMKRKP